MLITERIPQAGRRQAAGGSRHQGPDSIPVEAGKLQGLKPEGQCGQAAKAAEGDALSFSRRLLSSVGGGNAGVSMSGSELALESNLYQSVTL